LAALLNSPGWSNTFSIHHVILTRGVLWTIAASCYCRFCILLYCTYLFIYLFIIIYLLDTIIYLLDIYLMAVAIQTVSCVNLFGK